MLAIFDLTFRRFAAPSIAKFIYGLYMVLAVLLYLGVAVVAFQASSAGGIIWLLIVGPIAVMVYMALFRVFLEAIIAIIYTMQNTATLVTLGGGKPAGNVVILDASAGRGGPGAPGPPYGGQYPPVQQGGYNPGPPPGGYGQPPQQGGYGQPPAGYGQAPPPGGYGQPGQ